MESPTEAKGDGEAIEAILQGLASPVEEFVDDTPNSLRPYGLIHLRYASKSRWVMRSIVCGSDLRRRGATTPEICQGTCVYARFVLCKSAKSARFELKSRKCSILPGQRSTASSSPIGIAPYFACETVSFGCQFPGPADHAMELKAVLFNMEKLKVEKFPPLAQNPHRDYGLNPPRMRIRLWAGEETVGDLSLGEQEGDLIYVKKGENRTT